MTRSVVTCAPEDSVAIVANVMTQRRIRHLPVVVNGIVVGLISIGDVLKHRLDEVQLEADVLREVEGGGTIADIAHSLGLSQGTVRNHVSSAMLKMDARTRAEAAILARSAGWL